jgi:hypothetical protein
VVDLKKWECSVPGKEKTLWEGGLFKLEVTFPDGTFFFFGSSRKISQRLCVHRESFLADDS